MSNFSAQAVRPPIFSRFSVLSERLTILLLRYFLLSLRRHGYQAKGGGGVRWRWASLPGRVSRSSSRPWDPNCVERRPYDCSLPGLAGFDREEVATLSSESAPPPPTC